MMESVLSCGGEWHSQTTLIVLWMHGDYVVSGSGV